MEAVKQNLFLLQQIIHGEFQIRYRKSFLGLIWLFLEPLVSVVIWIFLYKAGIIHPGKSTISYPSYLLISTSMWAIFQQSFMDTSLSIKAHQKVFLTVRSNPMLYAVSKMVLSFFYSFIPLVIIVVLLAFNDLKVQLSWISLPLIVLPMLMAGGAMGLLNALFMVVSQDVSKLFNFFIHMLKYATPVIYTMEVSNDLLKTVMQYNPLTYLLNTPRQVILNSPNMDWNAYLMITMITLFIFILCASLFIKKSKLIIERVIN